MIDHWTADVKSPINFSLLEIDATLEIISLKCIHEIQVTKAEDKVLNQRPHSQAETGKESEAPGLEIPSATIPPLLYE